MGPVLDQSCGGFMQICGLLGILSWSATETYWKSTMSEWENNSVTKRIRTGTVRSVAEKTRASATYKRRCGCPHSSTKQALRNRNVKDGCWRSKTKNSVITFSIYYLVVGCRKLLKYLVVLIIYENQNRIWASYLLRMRLCECQEMVPWDHKGSNGSISNSPLSYVPLAP